MTAPDVEPSREEVRLRDAMPKPLLIAFAVLAVTTLGVVVALLAKPPTRADEPLARRHSPPSATHTHDVGGIANAPLPAGATPVASSCPALPRLRVLAGAAGQVRLGAAIASVCRLSAGGISATLAAAIHGLDGATLRFAAFDRTAEEATGDIPSKTLYVNLRFARANTPTVLVVPVLIHEGYHLSRGATPTATDEFQARVAELEACKLLIDRDKWIRNCEDAQAIVDLGESRAVELLAAAGYAR